MNRTKRRKLRWSGPPISEARAAVVAKGITINGLAILCRDTDCGGRPITYNLEEAFQREIVGGPGAFVVTAGNMHSFAAAVKRNLRRLAREANRRQRLY